ncbi:hypothetical protein LguiB_035712 [Lonicera macranthoides]
MDTNGKSICVLMFPWLGHGHISPFLELAKKLSQRNYFNIYLCSTPANFNSIKRKVAEDSSYSQIKLVGLHLPTLPNLPPHYHTTNGLPPHLMPVLKEAFDMASRNFSNILKTLKLDLLVNDFLQPWAVEAAKENNIPAVQFINSSATIFTYMLHVFKKPSNLCLDRIARNAKLRESAAKQDIKNCEIKCLELSSNIVVIKSFKEIEGKYIDYLSSLANKKLVPLGPLAQDSVNDDEDSKIIQWLNKKDLNSIVFVSFGSEYFLSNEDLEEIAHGLELSGVNFIWVVRFPMGENIRVDEKLPKGFFKRVTERGLVVEGWAPQAKILRHLNVGGFVSHCGWSSVMEGLTFGVPIVAVRIRKCGPPGLVPVGGGGHGTSERIPSFHLLECFR